MASAMSSGRPRRFTAWSAPISSKSSPLGVLLPRALGLDHARCDRVHRDPVRAGLGRERPSEADDASLAREVRGELRIPDVERRRRDVDDPSEPPLAHVRVDRSGHEEHAIQVDGQDAPPLGERELLEGRMRIDAGVVHEDVDPAFGREDRPEAPPRRLARLSHRPGAPKRRDRPCAIAAAAAVTASPSISNRATRAPSDAKPARRGPTDSAGRAGHDRDPSAQDRRGGPRHRHVS